MCVSGNIKKTCIEAENLSETPESMMIDSTMTKQRTTRRRTSATSDSSCSSNSKRTKRTYVEHNYCDHYNDPVSRPGDGEEGDDSDCPKRRGPRGGVVVPFPERLYDMLASVEEEGLEDVVSWQPHGRCFIVHQPKKFVEEVMPK